VVEFNSGAKARHADRFLNRRAEVYVTTRCLLETGELAVPHDEQLAAEMAATTRRLSDGRVARGV
jgi:hypothetical protein